MIAPSDSSEPVPQIPTGCRARVPRSRAVTPKRPASASPPSSASRTLQRRSKAWPDEAADTRMRTCMARSDVSVTCSPQTRPSHSGAASTTRVMMVGLLPVGTACAFSSTLRGFEFFLLPSRVHARPPLRLSKRWDRNVEKRLVFGVPNSILATYWQFLSLLWEIFMNIFRTRGFSTASLGGY